MCVCVCVFHTFKHFKILPNRLNAAKKYNDKDFYVEFVYQLERKHFKVFESLP